MNRTETHEIYEFDGFRLDRRRRVLSRLDGEAIPLKSKVFDTLLYLVEHADELLDKSTLIQAIWPNLVVEENNLNKTISVLRHVLGETPEDHRFIVTEPGRGYRFVAKVNTRDAQLEDVPLARHPGAAGARPWKKVSYVVTALIAAAVVLLLVTHYASRDSSIRPPAIRFEIDSARTLNLLNMSLSPDGRQIAYVGESERGISIWVRPLDSREAHALPGTEGGGAETEYPFWSPDSRSIAFRTGRQLKRVDVAGGAATTIVESAPSVRRGAWGPDGTILFASGDSGAAVIHRVSAAGGESVAVTQLDSSLGEITHSGPSFLPDGRHFLYKATNATRRNGAIYIGSLDPNERPIRLLQASRAIYVEPGFLLYTQEETLFARPFDPYRHEFTGAAVQIAGDVLYLEAIDTSAFDASNDGTLIFRRAERGGTQVPLVWVDRSGTTTAAGQSIAPVDFRLSPDAKRIVFSEGNPPGIWTLDIARGTRTRLTANPQVNHNAIWSPDGSSVAFDWHRDGNLTLYEKRADGADPGRTLLDAGAYEVIATDWSHDGRFIVFEKDPCVACPNDIWVLPMFGGGEPFAYAQSNFHERSGVLSPDGRWMAYMTSESGVYDVVVQAFPDAAQGKWQISANGGAAPRWARDGKELYYYDDVTRSVVRVGIKTDPVFEIGSAVRVADVSGAYQWDVTADGERLLKTAPAFTASGAPASGAALSGSTEPPVGTFPITVILNWTSLMRN